MHWREFVFKFSNSCVLKLSVTLTFCTFSSYLQISGGDEWFVKAYIPFIVKWAKLAEEEDVNLFAVGSEYVGTLDQTKQWLRVIRKVKKVYKGKTTYVGNHDVRNFILPGRHVAT